MQHNQQWQAEDSKVSPVTIPSLPDSLTSETAGSKEWSNHYSVQGDNNHSTPSSNSSDKELCKDGADDDAMSNPD